MRAVCTNRSCGGTGGWGPTAPCVMPCHAMLTPPAPTCAGSEGEPPLLGEDGQRVLHGCMELDYMTHIVLRMFENTT